MAYKYLNKKYAVRKLKRRKEFIAAFAVCLAIFAAGAVYSIDTTARQAMLPFAEPLFSVERTPPHSYTVKLAGHSLSFSTLPLYEMCDEVYSLFTTPPARIRIIYQLRAMLFNRLPPNLYAVNSKKAEY